jgi:Putative Flp pilus-assembly TadE/G-like
VNRRAREKGQVTLALLVVALLVAVGIFVTMTVRVGRAADEKARNRTAADAAALAGVEGARDELVDLLTRDGWPETWPDVPGAGGLGLAAARDYAERNYPGSEVIEYAFNLTAASSRVVVESPSKDGTPATSGATATARNWPRCDNVAPATPAPPAPGLRVRCDGRDFTLRRGPLPDGNVGYRVPDALLALFRDARDVRLVE